MGAGKCRPAAITAGPLQPHREQAQLCCWAHTASCVKRAPTAQRQHRSRLATVRMESQVAAAWGAAGAPAHGSPPAPASPPPAASPSSRPAPAPHPRPLLVQHGGSLPGCPGEPWRFARGQAKRGPGVARRRFSPAHPAGRLPRSVTCPSSGAPRVQHACLPRPSDIQQRPPCLPIHNASAERQVASAGPPAAGGAAPGDGTSGHCPTHQVVGGARRGLRGSGGSTGWPAGGAPQVAVCSAAC